MWCTHARLRCVAYQHVCVCVFRRQHTDVYRKDDVAATDTYYFLDPRDALATSSLPGGCLRSLSWQAAQIRELFF